MPTQSLILFGTSLCQLCAEAQAAVAEAIAGSEPTVTLRCVDIAEDETLFKRYSLRIPVLYEPRSGRELDWPFGPANVVAFLAAAGTAPSKNRTAR